jgi:hypothetical protein
MRYARWLVLLGCLGIGILVARYWSPLTPSKNSASHVSAAVTYHNKAAAIANKSGGTGVVSVVSASDWSAIYSYDERALREAQQADISDMNRYYPSYGDHFKNEFIEGLKLIVESGNNSANAPDFIRGQILEHRFGDWFEANEDAIRNKK